MFKLIKKELQSISWRVKLVLLLTLPSLFFLSYFDFSANNFKWNLSNEWNDLKAFWYSIGFLGAIFSIINVCLIANRKLSNFFYGFFSCLFYGLYCWYMGYYGDFLTNWFFYLPMVFVGYKKWKKGYSFKKIKILKNKWNVRHTGNIILMSCIIFSLWFFLTPFVGDLSQIVECLYKRKSVYDIFNKDWEYGFNYKFWNGTTTIKALWHPLHFFDAFTSTGAMVSTYYLNARLPADNIYYLLMNPASITMWAYLGDYSYVLLYSTYLIFAIMGVHDWFITKHAKIRFNKLVDVFKYKIK